MYEIRKLVWEISRDSKSFSQTRSILLDWSFRFRVQKRKYAETSFFSPFPHFPFLAQTSRQSPKTPISKSKYRADNCVFLHTTVEFVVESFSHFHSFAFGYVWIVSSVSFVCFWWPWHSSLHKNTKFYFSLLLNY